MEYVAKKIKNCTAVCYLFVVFITIYVISYKIYCIDYVTVNLLRSRYVKVPDQPSGKTSGSA